VNVLFVADRAYPAAGGSLTYLREMTERLASEGHSVEIYTTDALELDYFWNPRARRAAVPVETHNGVTIYRFPVRHTPLPRLTFPALRHLNARLSDARPFPPGWLRASARRTPPVPALHAALAARQAAPDVVHSINITLDGISLAASEYARRAGVPLVVTPFVHAGMPRFYTMRHQLDLLREAQAVIAQTELEHDLLVAGGIRPERLHVIGVGINPDELHGGNGEAFRAKYNITGPIVFTLGVLARDKGALQLLDAMASLWEQGSTATLVMAGQATPALSERVRLLPARYSARLCLPGYISEEDKRDLLDAGDIFVLTSRTESFGIVYLEAWLYNKSVVGARAGGAQEVIHDEQDGLLVPFGDAPALARAIGRLLDRPEWARALGISGHERTRGQTWEKQYGRLRDLYSTLLRPRIPSTPPVDPLL
jgi:glycosyltransferase involved in cell wall biosynthesis